MADSSRSGPPTDVEEVVANEVKEYHFHIYFQINDPAQHKEALDLRDAVLRLRKAGAFVAVPLFRVNTFPIGPHPAGSYEIWVPRESFAAVWSYLSLNRGTLSILIHPLTENEVADHEVRNAWIGPSFPLYLGALQRNLTKVPLQYPSLKLGYSSEEPEPSIEERAKAGAAIEKTLKGEKEAARAPDN